jgi:hypothetical protein
MGNCDSCVGGRGPPPPQPSYVSASPSPQPKQFKPERSGSFFTVSSGPVNYRILPADDPTIKIQPLPPPRPKKPGGI